MYHKGRGKTPKKNQNYKGVSINTHLYTQIAQFIEDNPQYTSIADFLSESARVRMEQVELAKQTKMKTFQEN